MYSVNAPAVYAHGSVMSNATYRSRVEGVVAALQEPREIVTYTDDQLPDMVQDGLLRNRVSMGKLAEVQDPILLFNTFRFDSKEEVQQRAKALQDRGIKPQAPLLGTGAFNWTYFDLKDDPSRNHKICRRCWRIHLQQGCLHRAMPFAEMKKTLPVDLLDPEYLREAEGSQPAPAETRAKPFPHGVRAEIYDFYIRKIRKHNTEVPLSLCAETGDMWGCFGDRLGLTPTNYVCGCGPQSTPGRTKLDCHAFDVAVRNDAGIPGVTG